MLHSAPTSTAPVSTAPAARPGGPGRVRTLGLPDLPAARALAATHPVVNVFVLARLAAAAAAGGFDGAQLWGHEVAGRLGAVCWSGANLVPVAADRSAAVAFAAHAAARGRRCSSVVGPAEQISAMWAGLEPSWGQPREIRARQPLLVIDPEVGLPAPAEQVRQVGPEEFDVLLPAAVAMFAEEVGLDPLRGAGARLYRTRVRELIEVGHTFAWIVGREVIFKAEIGATFGGVAQVQGVWVNPTWRGRGLAVPAMAAVVALTRLTIAPTVSLYVNDYNAAALATYRRVGFRTLDTFSSILF